MSKDFEKWNIEKKNSESDFKKVILKLQKLLKIENPLAGAFSEAEATNI